MKSPWDSVAQKFNTFKKRPYAGAMDNVLTVWPIAKQYIRSHLKTRSGKRALEYGCGTGNFCVELSKLGFQTTGIDSSPRMVKLGKKFVSKNIELLIGDYKTAAANRRRKGKFIFICGIMVFQFVADIKNCFKWLSQTLETGGHIFFAVHDPKILRARNIKNKLKLAGMDKAVPVFPRKAREYDQIFKKLKLKKILEKHIDYHPKFKQQYGRELGKNTPKYMILGYKKI
jgi:2-polyprenyl-3-methyl-5-hydroxy-6-metoxy-1,4-benzoquinol methylase